MRLLDYGNAMTRWKWIVDSLGSTLLALSLGGLIAVIVGAVGFFAQPILFPANALLLIAYGLGFAATRRQFHTTRQKFLEVGRYAAIAHRERLMTELVP